MINYCDDLLIYRSQARVRSIDASGAYLCHIITPSWFQPHVYVDHMLIIALITLFQYVKTWV